MEMELGPFPFPELSQTSMNPSSWIDSAGDVYTPAFPDEFPDFSILGDHHFQSTMPDFVTDAFSLHSPTDHTNNSFLLDLYDFHQNTYHPIPMAENAPLATEEDECNRFLNEDLFEAVAPLESQESFLDQVLASTSMSSTTTSSETEMDVNPTAFETDATTMGMTVQSQKREDEAEEEETDEEPKPSTTLNCKNLYSERNRRKRLSQQLLALRALVPNITKMDKRSVLVDALAYLRGIQEETARIETDLKELPSFQSGNSTPASTLPAQRKLTPKKTKSQILEIDTETIEDRRFVVKITCKGGPGVGGEVLRVIEAVGFEITYFALEQIKPLHILTTVFLRVRKQGRITEEKLKDSITNMALRSGLLLQNP